MSNTTYTPPGRIGNPDLSVGTDPRTNPKVRQALLELGLGGNSFSEIPDKSEWTIEGLTPSLAASDQMYTGLYDSLDNVLPSDADEPAIDITTQTIKGVDNNDIKLYIYKPAAATGPLPAVIYSHGGGMVLISTDNSAHRRWLRTLAVNGVIAIAVDFRNAYTAAGHNPFPAGLNDCAAAVKHISAHRAELGISTIVLQGESGGANLAITTALKANREGWINEIGGVYGTVPYISGAAYNWSHERKLKELPSLVENDGYLLYVKGSATSSWYYGPNDLENPHAWPYHSSIEDLKGLPPVVLDMNELDPLRDEGVVFGRKLAEAGVQVETKVTLGVIHGTALILRKAAPEFHNAAARDITAFAKSLVGSAGSGGEASKL